MGLVRDDFTLKNACDVANARRGGIKEKAVRQVTLRALADTGAATLVINEEVRRKLGVEVKRLRRVYDANDHWEVCKVTEPVEVHWHDWSMSCEALVTSESGETLVGAIPLEDMDLLVDPVRLQLVGAHGDEVVTCCK
ncbi:MAG: hypothetical protein LBR16_08200 [Treponema sp.]|jgi:hypothetical protein|nr:hypothetical protein [Treponema sp.]